MIDDPVVYGCELQIKYDGTVDDIIIHDINNSTWTTLSAEYGTFENSYLLMVSILISHQLQGRTICVEKAVNKIVLTTCA